MHTVFPFVGPHRWTSAGIEGDGEGRGEGVSELEGLVVSDDVADEALVGENVRELDLLPVNEAEVEVLLDIEAVGSGEEVREVDEPAVTVDEPDVLSDGVGSGENVREPDLLPDNEAEVEVLLDIEAVGSEDVVREVDEPVVVVDEPDTDPDDVTDASDEDVSDLDELAVIDDEVDVAFDGTAPDGEGKTEVLDDGVDRQTPYRVWHPAPQ